MESVNSWNDVNPGHKPLKELAQYVKEGVWAAGGTPAEFCVPAPCDGMAQLRGMQYILPSRDLIAGAVEAMWGAHHFDGLVFLCACDKIVPGMLMAAASIDVPSIFLTPGSTLPYEENGETFVTPDLKEAIGSFRAGTVDEETFGRYKQNICSSCGTCSMYGTANTMCVFAEAIGTRPPDSATIPFCVLPLNLSRRGTWASGSWIWCGKERPPEHSLRKSPWKTAFATLSAPPGGSSNFVMHVLAIAKCAGIPLDLKEFDEIQKDVPVIAKLKPSSKYNLIDYGKAGGSGASLKTIREYLHTDVPVVMGGTLGEYLDQYHRAIDREVIHTADDPLHADGCFSVLYGNLAPKGAVVKKSGVDPSMYYHRGPAVVFDSEEEVMDCLMNSDIRPGSVLDRRQGPKRRPRHARAFDSCGECPRGWSR